VKGVQVMLERIGHGSQTEMLQTYAHVD